MNNTEPIKLNVHYGDYTPNNSLKAYKAENEMKRAVIKNKDTVEKYLHNRFNLPYTFKFKKLESTEREEYSLVDMINDKLTNTNVSVCLSTYDIFKEKGIEAAVENLHLKSNLTTI